MTAYSPTLSKHDLFRAISRTSLVTGTLQLSALFLIQYLQVREYPASVLRIIASAVFGRAGIDKGWLLMTWGFVLHFSIVFLLTLVFFLVQPLLHRLLIYNWLVGINYGLFTWGVMQGIVLPLCGLRPLAQSSLFVCADVLRIVLLLGIPTAIIANRVYKRH